MSPDPELVSPAQKSGSKLDLLSVVMPVFNEAQFLPFQLDALAAQTYRGAWELLVADNGSTDGSGALAQRWADRIPGLRVVDASDRQGGNHARNVGASRAHGDFLAYCDADDGVMPGWLEAMAEAARHFDVVGGRLDLDSLNDSVTRAWRRPTADDALPVALGFLPYAVSCNMGVRTHVLSEVGGWDESYRGGSEEIAICWRAQLASYRIGFAPDAVVRYRYRGDLRALARQSYKYGFAMARLYHEFRDLGARTANDDFLVRWLAFRPMRAELARSGGQDEGTRTPGSWLLGARARGWWLRYFAYRAGSAEGHLRERLEPLRASNRDGEV